MHLYFFFQTLVCRFGQQQPLLITPLKAITATANKLARINWTLFIKKEIFDPSKLMPDPVLTKKKQIKNVTKKLLNLKLNKDELSILLNNVTGSLSAT